MEAIGLTASLIAILELCGKTILYIQTAKGGSKQKAQLMTEIQSLQLVTGQLHDVSDDDGWKKTMEILAEPGAPLKLLEETLRSLVQKLGPNAGLRRGLDVVLWPFQEKEVNSILAMIERQKASLSLALENNSRLLQDRIASQVDSNRDSLDELKTICGGLHDEINTVKLSLEQSRTRETLQWMTKLNFGPRHDTILQSWDRKSGTGTWILRHPLFIDWTASKTTETKLWCHGIPGAGKSVIAAIIFDHLRESLKPSNQYISVATLYCDHEQQADQNLDELERSILHQALADCAMIPTALQDLREETKDGFSPSLSKLHSVIASSPAASQTLFIVLDALDEASEAVQDQLVDRVSTLPFRDVRILCTSRTWPKFEKAFAELPQIQVFASDNDVATFVRDKIEKGARLREFMQGNSSLRDQVVFKVLEKAKGSFLMAKHHIDELSSANTRKQLLKKLEKLPEKMQDAYDLTMKRIRQQPSSDKTLAERTLSLVFGAHTQLNLWEIQHALATLTLYKYDRDDEEDEPDGIEEDDLPSADTIVQCCQGLLIVEDGDSEWLVPGIRASHYTASEYFRQTYRDCFPDGQVLLATACCYYLSQPSLQDAAENTPHKLHRRRRNLEFFTESVYPRDWIFEFFTYAIGYWGVHFFEARSKSPMSLRNHVEDTMQYGWTKLNKLKGLSYYRISGEVGHILAPFRVIRNIDQQGGDVNAIDDKGDCLLSKALFTDCHAFIFLLKLPSLEIDATALYFDRMLETSIIREMKDLTQRLLKVLALDKRLRDGTLSAKLSDAQNAVIKNYLRDSMDDYYNFDAMDQRFEFLHAIMGTLQDLDPQHDRALLLDLMSACQHTRGIEFEILNFFFSRNLRLEGTDADGNNILHVAAKIGHVGMTTFFLKQNLNPNLVNKQGESPCQVAINYNNFGVFMQLLSAMSVSARCLLSNTRQAGIGNSHAGRPREDGYTILLSEAQTGRFGSAVDAESRTALCWVAGGMWNEAEQWECVEFLLSLGTDVNWRDESGMTALSHHLSRSCNLSVVSTLLNAGANPNARDCHGMTPILYAASTIPTSSRTRLDVVKALLKNGANAGDKDNSGISAVGHVIYAYAQAFERADEHIKDILATLWVLLGNEALGPYFYDTITTGYEATRRLIELANSEKDALEERYQSDEPLEWLGRTQIDKTIRENIFELLTLAGMM